MNATEQLIAYCATLATLVVVFSVAMVGAAWSNGVASHIEVFGLGTVLGGLIGALRAPSAASKPIATTDSGDVNVTPVASAPTESRS